MHKLKELIEPNSVAVIGASERPGSLGAASLSNLLHADFAGRLYPINPKYQEVYGIPCYAGWDEVPEAVDCAIICTPSYTVPALVDEAGQAGARSAIVFASGFAETGEEGRNLQNELKAVTEKWDLPLCGPNCLGLVSFTNRFMGFGAPMTVEMTPGRISAVCQSGSVAIALLNSGRGLNYRTVVSSGNEAAVTLEDYLDFFVEDEETDTILAFVEGFRNVPKLRAVANRAGAKGKPIIIVKVGRSSVGRRAAIAHTGALAGTDRVMDALLKQIGIIRVLDLDEMLETGALFQQSRRPRGERLGMIGISGGEVGLLSDLAEDAGLTMGHLSSKTIAEMEELLPPFSNVTNPLDAWGVGDLGDTYAECLRRMAEDPGVDLVAVAQDSHAGLSDAQAAFYTNQAHSVVKVYEQTDKPIVLFSNVSGGFHPKMRAIFEAGRIPALQGTRESLRAIRRLIDFAARTAPARSKADVEPATVLEEMPEVQQLLEEGALSEHRSKRLLAAYGIPVTRGTVVSTEEEAVEEAARIGFPVVLKVDSPDIQHKSDMGAVRLDLANEESVARAYTEIMRNVRQACPEARINGILVQEMVDLENAVEVIAGISRDPQCGPVVLFGLGGIHVEVLKDVALRVVPLSEDAAWEMLGEIRGTGVLEGVRGKPAVDKAAIVDTLLRLSALAEQLEHQIAEIDINPLVVFPEGCGAVAADALVVTG